jgi:hypothetical protein
MKVATMTMRGCLLLLASLTVGSAGSAIAADETNPATETAKPAEPEAVPEKPKIDR